MKRIVICLLLLCICFGIKAQKLTLKSVSPLPMDLSVQNNPNPRRDQNGTPCALIRVGVVGVEDLTFPDAVGNVKRSLSEYMVYVPAGLKTLQYKNQSGSITGSVSFEDNDIDEIESKSVYSVVFESDSHLRAAIFSVEPKTATLTFDGKPVKLDAEGMAVITKPIGKYQYNVQANEYELQSGAVSLTEDDISTTTNVILRPKQYPLTIKCTPANAVLFIDNVSFGALKLQRFISLPCSTESTQNLTVLDFGLSNATRMESSVDAGYSSFHSVTSPVSILTKLSTVMSESLFSLLIMSVRPS